MVAQASRVKSGASGPAIVGVGSGRTGRAGRVGRVGLRNVGSIGRGPAVFGSGRLNRSWVNGVGPLCSAGRAVGFVNWLCRWGRSGRVGRRIKSGLVGSVGRAVRVAQAGRVGSSRGSVGRPRGSPNYSGGRIRQASLPVGHAGWVGLPDRAGGLPGRVGRSASRVGQSGRAVGPLRATQVDQASRVIGSVGREGRSFGRAASVRRLGRSCSPGGSVRLGRADRVGEAGRAGGAAGWLGRSGR